MQFIETQEFSKKIYKYLDEEELYDLQIYLMFNPDAGEVIPGSGSLRKVRWAGKGKGKRGGLRIIYFYKMRNCEIWLLDVYSKSNKENISSQELHELRKEVLND